MPTRERHITHLFDGGWATSYGPNAAVTVDQGGVVRIPFLVEAENVMYELDGGPRKCPGTTKVNSSALESGAAIKGMIDYWRHGTSGSPAQRRVIHLGTKVYADSGDGSFSQIASGLVNGAVPSYALFDDLLILSSDSSDVPKSWDQTTFQTLDASAPNFSFCVKHGNWCFAAGVDALPSRLYYSDQLDPEAWGGGTSGNIDIDPGDGDKITGLISHKGELLVFKGPYKGSIHRITGTSNSDWARKTFIEGVGAVWHNTIFRFGDDVGFLWSDGSIRSLNVTSAYGDFRELSLSAPIQSWLEDHLNFTKLQHAWAKTGPTGRRVYISVPVDSATTNNDVLVLDLGFSPLRWSHLPAYAVGSMALMIDTADNTRQEIYFGGQDGFVRKFGRSTRSIDGDTGIGYNVATPFMDYGVPEAMKVIAGVGLGIQPRNDGDITFQWQRDANPTKTQDISQGGSAAAVLGGASGFTLDTDVLGGDQFVHRWYPLEEGGEFRTIQYKFKNSTNLEDVEMHSFSTFIQPGGVSMEN